MKSRCPEPFSATTREVNSLQELPLCLRLYAMNLAGRSGPSEVLACAASTRPQAVEGLRCTLRGADWLRFEWRTRDPEGAPVQRCCLEAHRS